MKRSAKRVRAKPPEPSLSFVKMGKKVHLSFSNLPLAEWKKGKTVCHRAGLLWRMSVGEHLSLDEVCKQCLKAVNV